MTNTRDLPQDLLRKARAHWVARDTILWNVAGGPAQRFALFYSLGSALTPHAHGIAGGTEIPLHYASEGPGPTILAKFPHLAGHLTLKIAPEHFEQIPSALQGRLAAAMCDEQNNLLDATRLQIPGVLDDLYYYDGPLGITYAGDTPTLRVWAPTARSVTLHLFDDPLTPSSATMNMSLDRSTGVWSATGTPDWTGNYYLYEAEVYAPAAGAVVKNLVTDPYSVSLAANSTRSQIIDLNDPQLKPDGWDALVKPVLESPTDIVLYELHVRDFSSFDPSVPKRLRGTFAAFAEPDSHGIRHLRRLAQAGVTHIHLLPVFDIVSIEEERALHQEPNPKRLASFPPESPAQQQIVGALRDRDGFNWGYDPYHYSVPEGSYATDPNGPARIREFRSMVQALGQIGLRVVMDVVYNHTHASGQQAASVLDKLVPGYYHRLNADGAVENSTCCHNTASEHAMMEKLMLDSLRIWATAYKVDGFRFDLMGHHMVENIVNARDMLGALTPARDGVDGHTIYLYGEGWNFGEVANDVRGRNATQLNMAGTGVGTFNDRLRDAVRGGGAFSGFQEQGFVNGLFSAPNWSEWRSAEEQRATLLKYADWIRVGLAGNLHDYQLEDRHGHRTSGWQIEYNGQPTGYTFSPRENVIYVSAHDNETLFDAIQLKAPPGTVAAERARMAVVALSLVLLSQGVPFIHAGDELLRSKSLDRNSYDSGDWFNRIDWTYQTNNWGVGLPPEAENRSRWPIMAAILSDPALRPTSADIRQVLASFEEFLKIRRSSQLFRLRTAADIHRSLGFFNTGPYQSAGLIVMRLLADPARDGDPWSQIVVLFNGASYAQVFAGLAFVGAPLALHPVQTASQDPIIRGATFDAATGAFSVPAYSTAVFVGKRISD